MQPKCANRSCSGLVLALHRLLCLRLRLLFQIEIEIDIAMDATRQAPRLAVSELQRSQGLADRREAYSW